MIGVLVLEDNPISKAALAQMVTQVSGEIRVYEAETVQEAHAVLARGTQIDLFLLDIHLAQDRGQEDSAGLDFAKRLRLLPEHTFTPIVFLTSRAELEVTAYREAQCYAYLTKPVRRSEVERIVRKVLLHVRPQEERVITVKRDGINYRLPVGRLVMAQAIMRGIRIYLTDDEMEVKYLTLRVLLEMLPTTEFLRCHRMFIINTGHVEYVDFTNRLIKLTGENRVADIGAAYQADVRRWAKNAPTTAQK